MSGLQTVENLDIPKNGLHEMQKAVVFLLALLQSLTPLGPGRRRSGLKVAIQQQQDARTDELLHI